jgi:hypothetical protein
MHQPPDPIALKNESLLNKIRRKRSCRRRRISTKLFSLEKQLKSTPKICTGSGPLQPDRVSEKYRAERNYSRNGVSEQCRIKIFEISRTDYDKRGKEGRRGQTDEGRVKKIHRDLPVISDGRSHSGVSKVAGRHNQINACYQI